MKTFTKSLYLCGGMLVLGLTSCSSDLSVEEPIKTFETDKAVMNIRICAPSDLTKADGTSAAYGKGSDDENLVRKLNFYFYDKAGEFVTSKEGVYQVSNETPGYLVEEIGTSRIVLTDLLGQNYPSYVVAVINNNIGGTPTDDRFKMNLAEVRNAIRQNNPWTSRDGKITDFVMTSATHSGNSSDYWYFATPITEENFALQGEGSKPDDVWDESALNAKPVDIYVERLASKVEIKFPGYSLIKDGDKQYYEKTLPDKYNIDGVDTELKVRLYGWGINGKAKNMKYFKGVNDNPNPFTTTDGWDYSGSNRCYWAKTPGYGENNYSSSFSDVKTKSGGTVTEEDDIYANNEPLAYISWKDVVNNKFTGNNNVAYVIPHTEAGEKINLTGHQIFHGALTEVLVAGQIVDASGKPLTLFQLGESYYTKGGMINHVLNASGSHIWKKTSDDNYVTIDESDVDVVYGYDGTFRIKLNDQTIEWYQDNEGTLKWDNFAVVEAEINAYLPDHLSYCYNDGMTYYNIPIKHLRPYVQDAEIKTGMFGVVRNHWYQVSIGDIKTLGHSVYRPHEHIIPESDDTRYMIGSSVKILSWRIVSQTAEL